MYNLLFTFLIFYKKWYYKFYTFMRDFTCSNKLIVSYINKSWYIREIAASAWYMSFERFQRAKGELQRAVRGHLLSPLSCFWPHCLLPQDLNIPITYNPLSLSTMLPLSHIRNIVDSIDSFRIICSIVFYRTFVCFTFMTIGW